MMHEMTENDSAAYFKEPAWHGLGNVVDSVMGVDDAITASGLDWSVVKRGIWANGVTSDDYRALVRTDIDKIIGVVGERYKIVQNWEVFNLAKNFGDEVTVESAGSVQDGRKVYLLLQGESFDAGMGDEVQKYMALFWSHDGTQALTALPTSIRVVCKNTLDMVIGQAAGARNKITLTHAGDMEGKMEQARLAIVRFNESGVFFEEAVRRVADTNPSTREINQFFFEVYEKLNGIRINVNPQTEEEESVKLNALTSVAEWTETFEEENTDFGWNYWVAANAVTNSIQHRVNTRGRKRTPASRAYSNLIGKGATDSTTVFRHALSMV